jgi:hypothetical protein
MMNNMPRIVNILKDIPGIYHVTTLCSVPQQVSFVLRFSTGPETEAIEEMLRNWRLCSCLFAHARQYVG